ncbi:hypothetical protein [Microbacterium bovistercoris]|nr:hypothetical protein [Microbacterium bovistercoris]
MTDQQPVGEQPAAQQPSPRSGWWRSNALALGAVALLLPAVVVGTAWWGWKYAFPDSGQPLWAVEPSSGADTVELKGATWGPVKSKALTDTTGLDVPDDAKVVLVGVDVTPHEKKAPNCMTPTLVEQSSGRSWEPARYELGVPSSSDEPDSCVPTLEGETAEPYQLLLPFVVPDDAKGPYWVVIEPLFAKSEYVRFSIDP